MNKNRIGVYTPYLGGYYFGGILQGIHAVVQPLDVALIVVQGTADEHHSRLVWEQVDGWIIVQQAQGSAS
jgi:DNA-binding LacI/PurR family transcriptional regulator